MRVGLHLLVVCTAVLLGCSYSSAQEERGTIDFIVADSSTSLPVPGVAGFLATPSGLLGIGQTDSNGRITIQKEQIVASEAFLVLFCAEDYFCGAVRIADERLLEYDQRLIHLARFAL